MISSPAHGRLGGGVVRLGEDRRVVDVCGRHQRVLARVRRVQHLVGLAKDAGVAPAAVQHLAGIIILPIYVIKKRTKT